MIPGRDTLVLAGTWLVLAGTWPALAGPQAAGAAEDPAVRAYEQVTPVDKNGGDVGGPSLNGLFASALGQASSEGDAVTYISLSRFGDVQSGELVTQYMSQRNSDGWSTQSISPPNPTTGARGISLSPFHFFTSDLTSGLFEWREPALSADAPPGYDSLYIRDASGAYRVVTDVAPLNLSPESYFVSFAGATPDLSHVVFEANDALTPQAPPGSRSVYEWSGAGTRLVSVLPGTGAVAAAYAGAGDGYDEDFTDVISSDGSKIFWTDNENQLYVREDGAHTVKLNASRRAVTLGDGSAILRAATPDGLHVFFTDRVALTEEANDNGGGVYEYDSATKLLRDLTPFSRGNPGILGVLGVSGDGSIVYFVASESLTESHGGSVAPASGADNLYVATAAGVQFIATLSGDDWQDWTQSLEQRISRLTPDGKRLLFLSDASLTGYDNTDANTGLPDNELFIYRLGHGLACVSCNPSQARPVGPASLPRNVGQSYQPRVISNNGAQVFFNSADVLLPTDTNGQQDVYEYGQGALKLISTGTSNDVSALVDTGAEQRDVFFTTRSRLAPTDTDNDSDIYDARIGGGFPAPPPPPPPCEPETCHGPLTVPPPLSPPVTISVGAQPEAAQQAVPHAGDAKTGSRCKQARSAAIGRIKHLRGHRRQRTRRGAKRSPARRCDSTMKGKRS